MTGIVTLNLIEQLTRHLEDTGSIRVGICTAYVLVGCRFIPDID